MDTNTKGNKIVNVIIAGSRTFNNYELLKTKCDHYLADLKDCTIQIVSGKQVFYRKTNPESIEKFGADYLGEQYAIEREYPIIEFPADWDTYGKSAGPRRNDEMALFSDCAIIFWDGKSSGSKDMIERCKNRGLKFRVINYIDYV